MVRSFRDAFAWAMVLAAGLGTGCQLVSIPVTVIGARPHPEEVSLREEMRGILGEVREASRSLGSMALSLRMAEGEEASAKASLVTSDEFLSLFSSTDDDEVQWDEKGRSAFHYAPWNEGVLWMRKRSAKARLLFKGRVEKNAHATRIAEAEAWLEGASTPDAALTPFRVATAKRSCPVSESCGLDVQIHFEELGNFFALLLGEVVLRENKGELTLLVTPDRTSAAGKGLRLAVGPARIEIALLRYERLRSANAPSRLTVHGKVTALGGEREFRVDGNPHELAGLQAQFSPSPTPGGGQ